MIFFLNYSRLFIFTETRQGFFFFSLIGTNAYLTNIRLFLVYNYLHLSVVDFFALMLRRQKQQFKLQVQIASNLCKSAQFQNFKLKPVQIKNMHPIYQTYHSTELL